MSMSPKPNLRITDFKHHHHHHLQDFYLLNSRLLNFLACLIGNGLGNLVILEKNERVRKEKYVEVIEDEVASNYVEYFQ